MGLTQPTNLWYDGGMPTKRAPTAWESPQHVPVQMSIRMPYWRREQLGDEADALKINVTTLILDAVDRVYPPKPPKE